MRAVLDTNVIISGLLWRGTAYRCLQAKEAGLFELVTAEAILDELRSTLGEKFGISMPDVEESIRGLRGAASVVEIRGSGGWVAEDPDDDKIVDAAVEARADVIVSGDRHLLRLKSVAGIPVLSPREFLDRLTLS